MSRASSPAPIGSSDEIEPAFIIKRPCITQPEIDAILAKLLDTPQPPADYAALRATEPTMFMRKIHLINDDSVQQPPDAAAASAAVASADSKRIAADLRSPLILQTIWPPTNPADPSTTSASIELRLINCPAEGTGTVHYGHLTPAILATASKRLEIDADEFRAETHLMLTGEPLNVSAATCPTQPLHYVDAIAAQRALHEFELTPALDAGKPVTLTWRKRMAAGMSAVYGASLLQPQPLANLGDLLRATVDRHTVLADEQLRERCTAAVLQHNQTKLRAQFEECLAHRLEMEQGLLRKVMSFLDQKKSRVAQLQEVLRASQEEYGEVQQRLDAAVAWQPMAADDLIVRGDEGDSNCSNDSVFSRTLCGPATVEAARAAALAKAKAAKVNAAKVMRMDDDSQQSFADADGVSSSDSGGNCAGGDGDAEVAHGTRTTLPLQLAQLLPRRLAAVVAESRRFGQSPEPPPSSPAMATAEEEEEEEEEGEEADDSAAYNCDTERME